MSKKNVVKEKEVVVNPLEARRKEIAAEMAGLLKTKASFEKGLKDITDNQLRLEGAYAEITKLLGDKPVK